MKTAVRVRGKQQHAAAASKGLVLKTVKDYCALISFECSHLGWSTAELAATAGVAEPTARKHLQGKVKWPRVTTVISILKALGYTVRVVDES